MGSPERRCVRKEQITERVAGPVVAALAGYVHLRAQGQQAAACRHISRHPNRILPLLT
jgi:hypothetical protein